MKRVLSLTIAGLLTGAAHGADLLAVYRDAVAYDAQYAAARASLEAGREKLPQGRAGLMPTVGANLNTVWNRQDIVTRTSPTTESVVKYNSNGWGLSLTQPLFRWQNWVAYTQSEFVVAQAEAQFALARQELIVRVAQAYFDVLLAQDTLATARAQKAAIVEQLEAAKRNFEVGTATITDTHEAQSRHDLTVAQELAAESDLAVKRHALRALIGKDPEGLKKLRTDVKLAAPQPAAIDAWVSAAETSNVGVQIYSAGLEVASREVEKQNAGHLPTVDLVATAGRSAQSASFTLGVRPGFDVDAATIGIQVNVPLFAGGAISSRAREVTALREKAAADLENARRTAALNARQAYLGVHSGLAQVKAYEAALTSSQSALDSNKLGYDVGVRINIDVLNAQGQLFDTRQKLAKARLDTLGALLKLKAAAGSLSEDDLQAINTLLD